MPRGRVESFDAARGYGAVRQDQTEDLLFVHESALSAPDVLPLKAGAVVYFEVLDGEHGRQAVDVRVVSPREKPPSNSPKSAP
jgi:cold shock CspA family protein